MGVPRKSLVFPRFMPNMVKFMMNCVKTTFFFVLLIEDQEVLLKLVGDLGKGTVYFLAFFSCEVKVWLSYYRRLQVVSM